MFDLKEQNPPDPGRVYLRCTEAMMQGCDTQALLNYTLFIHKNTSALFSYADMQNTNAINCSQHIFSGIK